MTACTGSGAVRLLSDALQQPASAAKAARHVAFLVDGFPEPLGGGERALLRQATLLCEAGYRVSIVTFSIDPGCTALQQAPCPVYLLPLEGVFTSAAARGAWQLGRFLRRERVEIVETFFESSNLYGGLVTRLLSGARLIWNRRDMGILREPKHVAAYRRLGWLPHHVIAVSEQVRQHAIEHDGISPERVSVIHNGLDPVAWESVHAAPADADPLRVVCVGNLRHVKGQDLLLAAVEPLLRRYPELFVEFAGGPADPAYAAELEQRIVAAKLDGGVRLTGSVADLPAFLNGAAIFVLPSRSEGFSNAIVEAMAAGLPVVATDVGGNREAVDDGVTGFIVPADDVEALRGALERLLTDPDLRTRMGTAGRDRVTRLFTNESVRSKLLALYSRLLGQR